jgi:hypothetical protein
MFNLGDIVTFFLPDKKEKIRVTGQVVGFIGKPGTDKQGVKHLPPLMVKTQGLFEDAIYRVAQKNATFLKAGDYEITLQSEKAT